MGDKEKIIVYATEIAKKISDRLTQRSADGEFNALRKEAGELTLELATDPANSVTVQKIIECIRKFEKLNIKQLSPSLPDRSIVNQSVLSVRIKATHYSAFIAGKYGESDQIGSKFKCWIYNVTAHGAIETAILIDNLLKIAKKNAHPDLIAAAKLFRSSAISDAGRFLEWARKHDEKSALRMYNSARIDIISNNSDQTRFGIKRLSEIEPPDDNCEAPDICWHEDNWGSFQSDLMLQEIIKREAAHSHAIVKANLERSYSKATVLRELRGDIWKKEHRQNKAAIASFGAVMLALGSYAYEHPSAVTDAYDFSKVLLDYLQGIFALTIDPHSSIVTASIGDGGLAAPLRFARAIFGDGGLA